MKNTLSVQWVELAVKGSLLTLIEVLPGKLFRVKFTAPNAPGLREGDLLTRTGNAYSIQRKIGRGTVGGMLLSNLTIDKPMFDALRANAAKRNMTINDLRRDILYRWKEGVK